MDKLEELYNDFRDLPALIVCTILMAMILSLFDYVFFLMDRARPDLAGEVFVADVNREDSGYISKGNEETKRLEEALDDSGIKIVADKSLKDFEIWNGKIKTGEIKKDKPSQVKVFKRIGNHLYFGVSYDSADGYTLFRGPQEIYKLDLADNSLENVFGRDSFVSDISLDEKSLISFEQFYIGEKLNIYLNVRDLKQDGEGKYFQIPQKYMAAGNAYFSKDGKKIVYEVATADSRKAEFAMFVIDLETGEQKQLGGNESYGKAKVWMENN